MLCKLNQYVSYCNAKIITIIKPFQQVKSSTILVFKLNLVDPCCDINENGHFHNNISTKKPLLRSIFSDLSFYLDRITCYTHLVKLFNDEKSKS